MWPAGIKSYRAISLHQLRPAAAPRQTSSCLTQSTISPKTNRPKTVRRPQRKARIWSDHANSRRSSSVFNPHFEGKTNCRPVIAWLMMSQIEKANAAANGRDRSAEIVWIGASAIESTASARATRINRRFLGSWKRLMPKWTVRTVYAQPAFASDGNRPEILNANENTSMLNVLLISKLKPHDSCNHAIASFSSRNIFTLSPTLPAAVS